MAKTPSPPAQTVTEIQRAGAAGAALLQDVKSTAAQIPTEWFQRRGDHTSPMAPLVGTRFAMGLCCALLLAAKAPGTGVARHHGAVPKKGEHITQRRTAVWAELLGQSASPQTMRQMYDTLHLIQDCGLIEVTRPQGQNPVIRLLNPNKRGANFVAPKEHYVTLPEGFWALGWHAALTSRGLYMLLLSLQQNAETNGYPSREASSLRLEKPFWISPGRADRLYGLSADTRSRGWQELVDQELLTQGRELVDNNIDKKRYRNNYLFAHDPFNHAPTPYRID